MRKIKEKWKDVVGYEGVYQVSTIGRVKRIDSGKILRIAIRKDGYATVSLWKNNIGKSFCVHRLVALSFLENPEGKPMVNHIDSNKSNNNISNLEWCTRCENAKHGYDFGNVRPPRLDKKVWKVSLSGERIKMYMSIRDAAKDNNADDSHITKVLKGKLNKTANFKWEYHDEING
jgi:hypothetical protein